MTTQSPTNFLIYNTVHKILLYKKYIKTWSSKVFGITVRKPKIIKFKIVDSEYQMYLNFHKSLYSS